MSGPFDPIGSRGRASAHPLLYVLLALMLVNLAGIFVVYRQLTRMPEARSNQAALPEYLSRPALSALAERLLGHFNSKTWEALYDEFDPVAQVQFTQEQLENQFERLGPLVGRIERAEYSHYKYLGRQETGDARLRAPPAGRLGPGRRSGPFG